ncbi:unnamed protein product [Brassica oleracea]|uniref:(rape) hypothetical protein n=1 Tax=Brassica napus TaxID=3708 RepID=A0A816M6L5_BRANA|nr:unnamed protein product [Brassica napus]
MEWRPVNKDREGDEFRGERTLSTEHTRTPDTGRLLPQKEKDALVSSSGKTKSSAELPRIRSQGPSLVQGGPGETERITESIRDLVKHKEPRGKEPVKVSSGEVPALIKEKGLDTGTNKEVTQASEKETEEDEINKSIDEYAAMAMNEDMMDDDDLLDEIPEDFDEETATGEEQKNDGQIESDPQLPPAAPGNKSSKSRRSPIKPGVSDRTQEEMQELGLKSSKAKKEAA